MIRDHKADLLRLLELERQAGTVEPFDLAKISEQRTERAAIRERSGGQPRDQGEDDATQEVGPCYLCGGGRFWVSTFGVIVCERCHPPAVSRLVARVIVL